MNDFDKAIEFINIAEEYLKGEVNAITLAALIQREVDKTENESWICVQAFLLKRSWFEKAIDYLFGSKIHVSKISGNSSVNIKINK